MAGPSEIVPLRDVSEAAPEHAEVRPELAEVAVPERPLAPAAAGLDVGVPDEADEA